MSSGILVRQQIRRLLEQGAIHASQPVAGGQVQPASLDLRLGTVCHRVRAGFLPERCTVEERLRDLRLFTFSLEEGAILERGHCYLVPLLEQLALPDDVEAHSNPKSSTGRLDVFTRLLADHGDRFEAVTPGYHGPLYLEIVPRSFTIRVQTGLALNQLRFLRGDAALPGEDLRRLHDETPLLFDDAGTALRTGFDPRSGGLTMGVALAEDREISRYIGWRAKRFTGVLDMTKEGVHDPHEFFEPIEAPRDGRLIVEPEEFYIFASKERVRIPRDYAAVMLPYDVGIGELRTNYAGFFDNGFGEPRGTRAVLEVRPHDVPFVVEDGQAFFRLQFYRSSEAPDRAYGEDGQGSHYQGQALKLSKHFCEPRSSGARSS
ncbi:MAG: 2'-deoxycytidine 5'-triphosphate deaminase [Planctomycetes bacterium]|nr:2'-deoxycytidine 5'-triphosphate deaminase [Planctomycetota bacterium]